MPSTIITNIGEAKLATAAGNQTQVAISHIALGDGNGAAYNPLFAATQLRRERARKAIDSRVQLATKSWKVRATFSPDTAPFMIREIGFFDAAGALIALWAGADVDPRQTGVVEYVVDHVLNFSRVADGLIIVDAPDDDLFDFAVTQLAAQARQDRILFELNEAQRSHHGHYGEQA